MFLRFEEPNGAIGQAIRIETAIVRSRDAVRVATIQQTHQSFRTLIPELRSLDWVASRMVRSGPTMSVRHYTSWIWIGALPLYSALVVCSTTAGPDARAEK